MRLPKHKQLRRRKSKACDLPLLQDPISLNNQVIFLRELVFLGVCRGLFGNRPHANAWLVSVAPAVSPRPRRIGSLRLKLVLDCTRISGGRTLAWVEKLLSKSPLIWCTQSGGWIDSIDARPIHEWVHSLLDPVLPVSLRSLSTNGMLQKLIK